MRILHIASGDLWGGAEAQLWTLARSSAQLGADVGVALLNRESELGRRLRAAAIDVFELDETTASTPALAAALFRHARRRGADLIHTHRFKENIIGGAIARLLRLPSVRTVHGAPEPELLSGSLRRRILSAADAFAARSLQRGVVAVSDDLAAQLRPVLRGADIRVIPNGVDVAELRHSATLAAPLPPRTAGTFRIGFFGRLVPVKRVDLLLECAAQLRLLLPGAIECHVVGEGPQMQTLRELADKLQVNDVVRFAGFQAQSAAWISSMDCILLTSDHEGLPMIVLEALALGVPVVARAVGGIPEVLHHVKAARLVRGAAAQDIAAATASVLRERGSGMQQPSLLPERYTALSMARDYHSLYSALS